MFFDMNEIFPTLQDLKDGWLKADHSRLPEPLRSVNSALMALWRGDEALVTEELWRLVYIEGEDEETGEPLEYLADQQYPEAVFILALIESLEPDPEEALEFLKPHRGLSPAIDLEIEKLTYRYDALCPWTPEQGSNAYEMGAMWYQAGSLEIRKGNSSEALSAWSLGALEGSTEATYAIGCENAKRSNFLIAEACWTHLGALGHGTSMVSLGNLYEHTDRLFLAKYWWDAAFRQGTHERYAGQKLSLLESYDEELAERLSKAADRWWKEDSS